MSELGENSKISNNLEEVALKKISDFVSSFHSSLLPKANNSGVYRDLSEEEQYMLTSLDPESILHSILAGCLAVDSCLKNILKYEKMQNDNVMKTLTSALNSYGNLENQINKVSNWNLTQNYRKFGDILKSFFKLLNRPPFSDDISHFNNKQSLMYSQQSDQSNLTNDIHRQNIKLKEQLAEGEKQHVALQLKIMKLLQNAQSDDQQQLKHQNEGQKQLIKRMREEKNEIMMQMERMEEQIRILSRYNDRDANYLLEELQYEVECLKDEKKHDQRVINEIINKMEMLCIARNRSNLRSDNPKQNYTPTKTRLSRQIFQRPVTNFRKNATTRKSNIFDYQINDQKESKQNLYLYNGGESFRNDRSNIHQAPNDSFMPRYKEAKTGRMGLEGKNEFLSNSKTSHKQEGKTLNRIRTTYL